jgi:hypothetical protein
VRAGEEGGQVVAADYILGNGGHLAVDRRERVALCLAAAGEMKS